MKQIIYKKKSEVGSTLIEGAIVFPLMLLIVLSLIDVALYFTTQSVATQAASRAAFLASTAPGIDSANAVERNLALERIRKEAVDYALSTNFLGDPREEDTFGRALSLVIPKDESLISFATSTGLPYWPADSNNTTSPVSIFYPYNIYSGELANNDRALHEALTESPMEIQVHAQSFSIFLGYLFGHDGKFEITEHVFAYRQPSNEPAQPTPIDCGGDSAAFLRGECSCSGTDAGKVYDPTLDRCICKQGTVEDVDGQCGCPEGDYYTSYEVGEETFCYCQTWQAYNCTDNETFNEETCSCEADGCTDIGGENYTFNESSGLCQCDPRGCGYYQAYTNVFDCSTCETCEPGKVGSVYKDECVCQINPEYCSDAETHSEDTCTCNCDMGNFENNKTSCVYSGENKIFETYESGGVERCRCRDCYAGTIPNEDSSECVCDTDTLSSYCSELGAYVPLQGDGFCNCMPDVCGGNFVTNSGLSGLNLYYATLNKYYQENFGWNIFGGYGNPCMCPANIEEECEGSFDADTCSCNPCPDGFSSDGEGICVCDNAEATKALCDGDAGIRFNPETCACKACPADQIVSTDGESCEPCSTESTNFVRTTGTNECECTLDLSGELEQAYAQGGLKGYIDPDACIFVDCEQERAAGSPRSECECPADAKFYCNQDGRVWDEKLCLCESIGCTDLVNAQGNSFQELNASGTGCTCGDSLAFQAECLARGPNWYFSPSGCQCDLCPGNESGNTDSFGCGCDPDNIPDCPSGSGKDTSSCGCVACPGQQTQGADGFCECPADAAENCLASGLPYSSGSCDCGAACQGSEEIDTDTYQCICPASIETDCTDGIFDPDTCTCTPCPDGKSKVGEECVCDVTPTCFTGEYLNTEICACDTCTDGKVPNVPDRTACIDCPANYTANPSSPDNCICNITCGVAERRVIDAGQCACESCEPGKYQNAVDPTAECQCPVDPDCDNYDQFACRCVDEDMSECTSGAIAQYTSSCCENDGDFVAAGAGIGGYCNPTNCLNCELSDEEISKCLGELQGSPGCQISQSEK